MKFDLRGFGLWLDRDGGSAIRGRLRKKVVQELTASEATDNKQQKIAQKNGLATHNVVPNTLHTSIIAHIPLIVNSFWDFGRLESVLRRI